MAVEEEKNKSVTEQNAPQNPAEVMDVTTPQTGEDNTKVKAGTPSGTVGLSPGNLSAKIDLAKETERLANQHKITEATRGYDYQGKIYDEMISRLNAPESPEEKAKREKKERSKKIIAAVSDGLSALGNLFFTSQYAPNMYNHEKGSQLNSTMAAIEKAKAEREKNDEAYYNLALKIGDLNNQRAKTVREMEAQAEAQKIARQRAEDAHKAAEAERALDPYRQDKAMNDALTSGYKSVTAQAEAEAAPEYYNGRNRLNDERVKTEGTKQQSNLASAYEHTQKGNKAGQNTGGSKTIRSLELEDGIQTYESLENYKEGVQYWAKEYGIPTKRTVVTEKGIGGLPDKTKEIDRNTEEIAADIKRESLKRRKSKRGSITSTPEGDKKQWSNTANIKW